MAFKPLIVDTNVWVSLYQPKDPLHLKTKTVFQSNTLDLFRITITNYILLETVTVLSQQAGQKIAQIATKFLTHPSNLDRIQITEAMDQQALRLMFSQTSKNFSFVDASILAILKSNPQITLFTFDTRLAKLARAQNSSLLP